EVVARRRDRRLSCARRGLERRGDARSGLRMTRLATVGVATMALAGCGLVGPDPGAPEALPYNGTGEFRSLTAEETGVVGTPTGRVLFLQAEAFDRGMVA